MATQLITLSFDCLIGEFTACAREAEVLDRSYPMWAGTFAVAHVRSGIAWKMIDIITHMEHVLRQIEEFKVADDLETEIEPGSVFVLSSAKGLVAAMVAATKAERIKAAREYEHAAREKKRNGR